MAVQDRAVNASFKAVLPAGKKGILEFINREARKLSELHLTERGVGM